MSPTTTEAKKLKDVTKTFEVHLPLIWMKMQFFNFCSTGAAPVLTTGNDCPTKRPAF